MPNKCPVKSNGKKCSSDAGHQCPGIVCLQHALNHAGSSENSWAAKNGWSVDEWDTGHDNVKSLRGPNNKVVKKTSHTIPLEFYADASIAVGKLGTMTDIIDEINSQKVKNKAKKGLIKLRESGEFVQNNAFRTCVMTKSCNALCANHEINGCERYPIYSMQGWLCFRCMMEAVEYVNDFDNQRCIITFVVSSSGLIEGKGPGDIVT